MDHDDHDDPDLLPRSPPPRKHFMRCVRAISGLCQCPIGALPVWGGKTDLCPVSRPLLPARTPRTSAGHHALCRPAHGLGAPHPKPSPLGRRLSRSARALKERTCGLERIEINRKWPPSLEAVLFSKAISTQWPSQVVAIGCAGSPNSLSLTIFTRTSPGVLTKYCQIKVSGHWAVN